MNTYSFSWVWCGVAVDPVTSGVQAKRGYTRWAFPLKPQLPEGCLADILLRTCSTCEFLPGFCARTRDPPKWLPFRPLSLCPIQGAGPELQLRDSCRMFGCESRVIGECLFCGATRLCCTFTHTQAFCSLSAGLQGFIMRCLGARWSDVLLPKCHD